MVIGSTHKVTLSKATIEDIVDFNPQDSQWKLRNLVVGVKFPISTETALKLGPKHSYSERKLELNIRSYKS